MVLNGILGGLVGITAGADLMSPTEAILIGFIAGIIIPLSVVFFDRTLKLDDPVGATSVHLVCGIWGTLAVGIFGSAAGIGQLLDQLIGIAAVGAFTFVFAFILISILKVTIGIRVEEEEEIKGLDLAEHDMQAYPEKEESFAFAME
jgi:Amt family ammonium transporter